MILIIKKHDNVHKIPKNEKPNLCKENPRPDLTIKKIK